MSTDISRMGPTTGAYATVRAQNESLTAEVNQDRRNIADLQTRTEVLSQQLLQAQTTIHDLNQKVETLAPQVTHLQTRVNELEEQKRESSAPSPLQLLMSHHPILNRLGNLPNMSAEARAAVLMREIHRLHSNVARMNVQAQSLQASCNRGQRFLHEISLVVTSVRTEQERLREDINAQRASIERERQEREGVTSQIANVQRNVVRLQVELETERSDRIRFEANFRRQLTVQNAAIQMVTDRLLVNSYESRVFIHEIALCAIFGIVESMILSSNPFGFLIAKETLRRGYWPSHDFESPVGKATYYNFDRGARSVLESGKEIAIQTTAKYLLEAFNSYKIKSDNNEKLAREIAVAFVDYLSEAIYNPSQFLSGNFAKKLEEIFRSNGVVVPENFDLATLCKKIASSLYSDHEWNIDWKGIPLWLARKVVNWPLKALVSAATFSVVERVWSYTRPEETPEIRQATARLARLQLGER